MELTHDIAQGMIRERVDKYQPVRDLVADPEFDQNLQEALDFEGVDRSLFSTIRFNLLIVLTLYAPLDELGTNIAEDTGLTITQSESLAQTIKAVVIPPDLLEDLIRAQIYQEEEDQEDDNNPIDGRLVAMREVFETRDPAAFANTPAPLGEVPDADSVIRDELLLKPRMTEKIVSRAVPEPGAKPLTREDILRSLAAKRTLASDVSALQQNDGQ